MSIHKSLTERIRRNVELRVVNCRKYNASKNLDQVDEVVDRTHRTALTRGYFFLTKTKTQQKTRLIVMLTRVTREESEWQPHLK